MLRNFYFRFESVVKGSVRDLYGLLEAYYPSPSYDDMAWYGLSYARIHEVMTPLFRPQNVLSTRMHEFVFALFLPYTQGLIWTMRGPRLFDR